MVLSKEDLKWRAKDDARMLIEAEAINADSARKRKAITEVKVIALDAKKRATAAEKVAKSKVSPKRKRSKK